jgi:hypothetical protein
MQKISEIAEDKRTIIAPVSENLPVDPFQLTALGIQAMVTNTSRRVEAIQAIYKKIMRDGSDYGVIPGCGSKPALLKPGAEKIVMAFRLSPTTVHTITELGGGHREVVIRTTLHAADGTVLGDGVGSCSTMETKYRYRQAERICPSCSKATIIKGKAEYGGGWICFAKKGGCGAKFSDGDPAIEKQNVGRVENPDVADQYNTVLKMAEKRSLVDVVLRVAGASDIFTQDIEENAVAAEQPPTEQKPGAAPQNSSSKELNAADKRVEIMRRMDAAGFNSTEIDTYFVEKGWIKKGEAFPDLLDMEINTLYERYDLFVARFTVWKKAREGGKK